MNGTTLNVTEHMPKNINIMKKSGSVADLESYNKWGIYVQKAHILNHYCPLSYYLGRSMASCIYHAVDWPP